jgi:hypothetical protein
MIRTCTIAIAALAGAAQAQFLPDWIGIVPPETDSGGMQEMIVDEAGYSYVTASTLPPLSSDVATACFDQQGNIVWWHVYDGPAHKYDQARGMAFGPNDTVLVCGNTPGAGSYGDVLVLKYDRFTGELLDTIQWTSAQYTAEHGASVAADADGNIYVGGGTVGDGLDGLLVSFDADGNFRWKTTYDGAAFGPYSQDSIREVRLAQDGTLVVRIHAVTEQLHPDYLIAKHDTADGSVIWQSYWGLNSEDSSADMEFDADANIFVTGTAEQGIDKFGTIKLRGTDGALLWQAYDDLHGYHNVANAVALDGAGGVYVTGYSDPDFDKSNYNDRYYTVKRDAETGALLWEHNYGETCVGCLDRAEDVLVDGAGHALVVGNAGSPPYAGAMLLFNLDADTGVEIDQGTIGMEPGVAADAGIMRFDAEENLYIGGQYFDVNTGADGMAVFKYPSLVTGDCAADCNADGDLNILDFVCFQNVFSAGDIAADCNADGDLNILDFVCYQNLFSAGCP